YFFDKEVAERAVRFIQTFCTHTKGKLAGTPYLLQDWEREFITNLFGWKVKTTGLRKYTEAFLQIPRKNSKTTLSAAISIYMLVGDGEQGGELVAGASTRDQARISFDIISRMVKNNPTLKKNLLTLRSSIE